MIIWVHVLAGFIVILLCVVFYQDGYKEALQDVDILKVKEEKEEEENEN